MSLGRFFMTLSLGLVQAVPAQSALLSLTIGDSAGEPGGVAHFEVSLRGVAEGGVAVNNAQLDILIPSVVFDVTSAAVCTPDPGYTTFAHTESLPVDRHEVPDSRRLRLSIIDTVAPLGGVVDGPLFTCSLPIRADAPRGLTRLIATRPNVGDVYGKVLPIQTNSGTVAIGSSFSELPGGYTCFADGQCASSFCTEGVCCQARACGAGYSCLVIGREGVCASNRSPTPSRAPTITPTPTATVVPQVNAAACVQDVHCISGSCVDRVCCAQRCAPEQRCDISGFEGSCAAPAALDELCQKHTDCTPGLGCRDAADGTLRCAARPALGDVMASTTGSGGPILLAESAGGNPGNAGAAADADGCQLGAAAGASPVASWLLVCSLFLFSRCRATPRTSRT